MALLTNCWAGSFSSSNHDYITCGSHAAFNFAPTFNEFSIAVWFKTTASGTQIAVGRGTDSILQYGLGTVGRYIKSYIGNQQFSDNAETLAAVLIDDDDWHFAVMSVKLSPMQVTTYVDGVLLAQHNYSGTSLVAADLLIGGIRNSGNTGATLSWDGQLDEVGIWNSALSSDEVTELWASGHGLLYGEDAGLYTSSGALQGWWRIGDGSTELPGTYTPTALVQDVSGNGRHGTITIVTSLQDFYWGGANVSQPVPGSNTCIELLSSLVIPTPENFLTITRQDQGNLLAVTGLQGGLHRMIVECVSSPGVDNKIFVHEIARPVIGSTLRNHAFRRVARLVDLVNVPVDAPGSVFPYAYRTNRAEITASTPSDLDRVWQEVQRQCAVFANDMQAYGLPVLEGNQLSYLGGGQGLITRGSATFSVIGTNNTTVTTGSSSSSYSVLEQSSSYAIPVEYSSSHYVAQGSSSSAYVDPYAFTTTVLLADSSDAATRRNANGVLTLFTDLDFIRFGRDELATTTWDAFLRFPIDLPRCAEIVGASLQLRGHTAETGDDVVLQVRNIYDDGSLITMSAFSGTSDPTYTLNRNWDRLAASSGTSTPFEFDVTDLLQYYVNRSNYDSGQYFGLWLREYVSDAGARRDATKLEGAEPRLFISYRTDSHCSSSH